MRQPAQPFSRFEGLMAPGSLGLIPEDGDGGRRLDDHQAGNPRSSYLKTSPPALASAARLKPIALQNPGAVHFGGHRLRP